MKQFIASIISHAPVSDCFFDLTFAWDSHAGIPLPGQFCTLRISPFSAPLLRRPFAFSAYDNELGSVSIIYKRRGPATELLAAKKPGDTIDIIGPLGTPFGSGSGATGPVLCVAGGTGFGPMLFLSTELAKQCRTPIVVLGCRTKSQLPALKTLLSLDPVITTDDGSEGTKGTPLDFLKTFSKQKAGALCACGPMPLMKGCHDWATTNEIPCFVSLEQTMACGVGACMGCAVKVKAGSGSGYARVCTEGPVFDSTRIIWT
jgi:dihydroorotate dehydrogenase electron transfer subunit